MPTVEQLFVYAVEQIRVAASESSGLAFGFPTCPRAVTVTELQDCQVVVVAARARFTNTNGTDIRMGGAMANGPIIIELALALRGFGGVVVMVTNPVDLMSRLFAELSGITRVVGIGSNLDSARYRLILARLLDVPVGTVQGSVIGEHGDALVVCASSTTVNGEAVHVPVDQVRAALLDRSRQISSGIGRTRGGPAGAVLSTLRLLLGLADGVEELCRPYRRGWLGLPVSFTGGHAHVRLPPLDPEETSCLEAADVKLHAAYAALSEQFSSFRGSGFPR